MVEKQTPEEKARADAYEAGALSEREHTLRVSVECGVQRARAETAERRLAERERDLAAIRAALPTPSTPAEDAARLAEIGARSKAATPGPWEHGDDRRDCAIVRRVDRDGEMVSCICTNIDDSDATFIAAARADIPWLLADNRSLRTQLDAMREERDTASAAEDERADACERAERERDEARAHLAEMREREAAKLARRVELEDECARLDSRAIVARVAQGEAESRLAALVEAAQAVTNAQDACNAYRNQDADDAMDLSIVALSLALDSLAPTAKARDERLVATERARADAAEARLDAARQEGREAGITDHRALPQPVAAGGVRDWLAELVERRFHRAISAEECAEWNLALTRVGPPPIDRELLRAVVISALRDGADIKCMEHDDEWIAIIIDRALAEHGKVRR